MIRDLLDSWRAWLRYYRTGRPPAQAVQPFTFTLTDAPAVDVEPWPLRPCPFCGLAAETNGIAVWCPTLTHGLMTRAQWQERQETR